MIEGYQRHLDITRNIWNDIPNSDKKGINSFKIGSPPPSGKNAAGTFDPNDNSLGIHINNIGIDENSSDDEIRNKVGATMVHEIAHSQYHKLYPAQRDDWSKEALKNEPITSYLKKFKNRVIKSEKKRIEIQNERYRILDEIDDIDKKIKSNELSDKSDDFLIKSPLEKAIEEKQSLERYLENQDLLYNAALREEKINKATYGNETHSEFLVMKKGYESLGWKQDKEAFERLVPIYNKILGMSL